jgi:CubicO group peptidase (beta-lactamase class C family)
MKRNVFIYLISLSLLFSGCTENIQQIFNPLAYRIDQYLTKEADKSFSGAVLVAQKGTIIIQKGYGLANREWDIQNTIHTKFAIGSISKSFTAMAIMILQERDQLNVQDTICEYLSDCPSAWRPITLHHLLTHSSGIKEYNELYNQSNSIIDPCREYKPEEFIDIFKALPLEFEPGSTWKYSNSGYYLLGIVIEKVSDESYEEFIQENILLPLGMSESGYDKTKAIIKNRATGYSWNGQDKDLDCLDESQKYSAYGLYSTVGDLYKWDQTLYDNQLVTKQTLEKMFTSYFPIPPEFGRGYLGKDSGYGYGWAILQRYDRRVTEHAGGVVGFTSVITRYPEDYVTIIILSNRDQTTKDYIDPEVINNKLETLIYENN